MKKEHKIGEAHEKQFHDNTEDSIHSTQQKLEALEAKYSALFDNLADEVHLWELIYNKNGDIDFWQLVDANPPTLKSWNKNKVEVVGKTPNEIFGYDAIGQFMPTVKKIVETGKAYNWVQYFEPTNQYLSMKSIPLGNYFISTGEDITEKVVAEKALFNSERKYRNIAENIAGVVLRYKLKPDGTDKLEFVSDGIYDIYEVTKEDAIKNNGLLWDRVHKDDVKGYLESIQDSAKNLSAWSFEHRVQLPNGRIKWVHLNGIPTKQSDGSIIWDTVGLDITEKVEAKQQLELLNKSLEKRVEERTKALLKTTEELELYKLAAEQSTSGVWYWDLGANELKWDQTMYELYGIEPEDFKGAFEAWESSLHPQDKKRALDELNNAINGKKPFDTVFRIKQAKTGKTLHIRGKGKVDYNNKQEPIAVYGTNWDVSRELKLAEQRKEALRNLRDAQSQMVLSEKMATIGALTAGVAHEINNPLNYILGGHKAIKNHLANNPDLQHHKLEKYLDWIRVGAEKASKVVRSLNLLSRNDHNSTENCDVHRIISDSLLMLNHTYKDRININKKFKADRTTVVGNNGELHQVFLNLLSNAINAIADQGEITISTSLKQDQLKVIIQDGGCGIRKQDLKKVTEPFYTTKSPGKGMGLGLSIAKTLILKHGGKLHFQSELGIGTTVTVVLPQKESR